MAGILVVQICARCTDEVGGSEAKWEVEGRDKRKKRTRHGRTDAQCALRLGSARIFACAGLCAVHRELCDFPRDFLFRGASVAVAPDKFVGNWIAPGCWKVARARASGGGTRSPSHFQIGMRRCWVWEPSGYVAVMKGWKKGEGAVMNRCGAVGFSAHAGRPLRSVASRFCDTPAVRFPWAAFRGWTWGQLWVSAKSGVSE